MEKEIPVIQNLRGDLSIAPTAIKFLDSDKLGKEYENDMFVSDFNDGNIYRFELNRNRTRLNLSGSLPHKIINNEEELKTTLFGQGFGAITILKLGLMETYTFFLFIKEAGIVG